MFRRDFLSSSMFGFLSFGIFNTTRKGQKDTSGFWEKPANGKEHDYSVHVLRNIEKRVVEWLEFSKESSYTITLYSNYYESQITKEITFWRSEVNIKSCYNVWEVWHIATCQGYPKIFSFKVKEVGTNDTSVVDNGFVMPNEIRTMNYKTI